MNHDAIKCSWECSVCRTKGTWELTPRAEETPDEMAARHARWTRSSCKRGCGFTSTPSEKQVEQAS
jgi:hypothetical protein